MKKIKRKNKYHLLDNIKNKPLKKIKRENEIKIDMEKFKKHF